MRLAGPGDAEIMAAHPRRLFPARLGCSRVRANFSAPPAASSLLAAPGEGASAQGLLVARVAGDEAELLTLGVLPACRRQGIAQGAAWGRHDRACGAPAPSSLFLEMEDGNAPARGLYQSLGAVVVGRRPRYYAHGADAAIFSLAL